MFYRLYKVEKSVHNIKGKWWRTLYPLEHNIQNLLVLKLDISHTTVLNPSTVIAPFL